MNKLELFSEGDIGKVAKLLECSHVLVWKVSKKSEEELTTKHQMRIRVLLERISEDNIRLEEFALSLRENKSLQHA